MTTVGIFNVRLVRQGEKYGRNDCLTHEHPEALVEFYDRRYPKFGPLGQFVSRYYLSTLMAAQGGLNMQGGVSAWQMSASELEQVQGWHIEQ